MNRHWLFWPDDFSSTGWGKSSKRLLKTLLHGEDSEATKLPGDRQNENPELWANTLTAVTP